MKDKILSYLNNNNHYWWTVGLLPGMYAMTYLYTNNYTLVNSWTQFSYLVLTMTIIPSTITILGNFLLRNKSQRIKTIFNSSVFIITAGITLSLVIYFRYRWKGIILLIVAAIVVSWLIGKHYKKGVLFLALMTLIGIAQFNYYYFTKIINKEQWITDNNIAETTFTKKPNIYLIQPDGYAGKIALLNEYYNYDNSLFYDQMSELGFKFNHNYRSNYPSTLSSNITLFSGQHHFYENGTMINEPIDAREIIMENNPVLKAFKSNGYFTTAILQHRYLLMNHPAIGYDRINISEDELAIIPNHELNKDYISELEKALSTENSQPQFYFIEILEPGHIPNEMGKDTSIKKERDKYIEKLKSTNEDLIQMTSMITNHDPNAIVVIAADHGGFVGFNYSTECFIEPSNKTYLHQAIFSALLTIKAPTEFQSYHNNIKSTISVFPTLFNYLAQDSVTKNKLDNSSYQLIKSGTQRGIYKYYDENGIPVTEKIQ
ncbi:hypothetical protein BST92_03235 [Nonlabens arenilitoris]|uniref:Sulfatase N-terminal domain-containing protein n=1 Tax=Nonlabens arenilitoris TaxID=1217969 RepID=A0A2S7U7R1_9FLAO|nr:hypothetical protein [Nonlabens arenilitoris]PQJ31005.1 hypothetical protein BST92_03235 [Nonlabens arenilitoris]